MSNLINSTFTRTILGNNFDSAEGSIYKDDNELITDFVFTKTLRNPTLIFRETEAGRLLDNINEYNTRVTLPPDNPIIGPFIPNYCHTGSLLNTDFINLLLVNKPPIRTGFYDFRIGGASFVGLITRLTEYEHWNWQTNFGEYNYVKQNLNLGYGIEISNNLLYTAAYSQEDQKYIYTPTALYNFLSNLTGDEEIVSSASSKDPNTYLSPIPGYDGENINSGLPVELFFIPPADALRYIASYEDLIEGLGTDFVGGQEHYAKFARPILFNPISYLNSNPDLRIIYGYDTYSATEHYITTGFFAGRQWEQGSIFNILTGGLYDEREGDFGLSAGSIIWSNGKTLFNNNKSLNYRYNRDVYYLNGALDVSNELTFLRRQ